MEIEGAGRERWNCRPFPNPSKLGGIKVTGKKYVVRREEDAELTPPGPAVGQSTSFPGSRGCGGDGW